MVTKFLGGAAAAVILATVATQLAIRSIENPKYQSSHSENEVLAFDYPATWAQPRWHGPDSNHNEYDTRIGPRDLDLNYHAPFDTRWDWDDTNLRIEIQVQSKLLEPRQWLTTIAANAHKERPAYYPEQSDIQPIKISGHDGWVLNQPYYPEALDIGLPPKAGFLKGLYASFYGGQATQHLAVIVVGDRRYHIRYNLPGDKIARKRYEKVYGRIIDSLVIKQS